MKGELNEVTVDTFIDIQQQAIVTEQCDFFSEKMTDRHKIRKMFNTYQEPSTHYPIYNSEEDRSENVPNSGGERDGSKILYKIFAL